MPKHMRINAFAFGSGNRKKVYYARTADFSRLLGDLSEITISRLPVGH